MGTTCRDVTVAEVTHGARRARVCAMGARGVGGRRLGQPTRTRLPCPWGNEDSDSRTRLRLDAARECGVRQARVISPCGKYRCPSRERRGLVCVCVEGRRGAGGGDQAQGQGARALHDAALEVRVGAGWAGAGEGPRDEDEAARAAASGAYLAGAAATGGWRGCERRSRVSRGAKPEPASRRSPRHGRFASGGDGDGGARVQRRRVERDAQSTRRSKARWAASRDAVRTPRPVTPPSHTRPKSPARVHRRRVKAQRRLAHAHHHLAHLIAAPPAPRHPVSLRPPRPLEGRHALLRAASGPEARFRRRWGQAGGGGGPERLYKPLRYALRHLRHAARPPCGTRAERYGSGPRHSGAKRARGRLRRRTRAWNAASRGVNTRARGGPGRRAWHGLGGRGGGRGGAGRRACNAWGWGGGLEGGAGGDDAGLGEGADYVGHRLPPRA